MAESDELEAQISLQVLITQKAALLATRKQFWCGCEEEQGRAREEQKSLKSDLKDDWFVRKLRISMEGLQQCVDTGR